MVTNTDAGLWAFMNEYVKLTMQDRKLLRTDFFEHDGQWSVNLLLAEPGRHLLVNEQGEELCGFEKMTPLFLPIPRPGAAILAEDLLEQATVFRTRVSREQYHNLQMTIEALQYSNTVLADGYLVKQDGLLGVVSPIGKVTVPIQYASVEPFAFDEELGTHTKSTAGLYLCHRPGHTINLLDVYDLNGNCIFRDISSIHAREHALVAEKDPEAPQKKLLRSLWVTRQTIDRPFPENPDFMITKNETHRFTRKELSNPVSEGLRVGILDTKAGLCYHHDIPVEHLKELIFPMAEAIAAQSNSSPAEIISRLEDYEAFQRERSGNRFYLKDIHPSTPLDKVGFTVPTYTCLIRSGLRTIDDLNPSRKLRNANPKILEEIHLFLKDLNKQN